MKSPYRGGLGMEYRLSELIGKGFWESHRGLKRGDVTELIEKGGRGSGKSSFLSIEMLLTLLRYPRCHGVAVRKVGNTLRSSVYAQLLWAVHALGLTGRFKCTLSPLEMEYLPTGQKILFFGMDDPGKLKSIKVARGYIGVCWFEELDQFEPEEIRSVEQSVFRGGEVAISLKSFNPPPWTGHWVNLLALEEKPGRRVHHSTYAELPPAWLGSRFLADAEHLSRVNPEAYRNEYLGESVGAGGGVFRNLRLEAIPDVNGFDRVVSGVDWGWWPDPFAFNRVHYDAARRVLYVFDELTCHRTGNRETAAMVKERIARGETVIADSAEQKSIADYRSLGIDCRGAQKGPGSVEESMKWLQSLAAIHIDPRRCPDTAREFAGYQYEKKGGEVLPGFPDRDNHHIDAVRYAVSRIWRRRGA